MHFACVSRAGRISALYSVFWQLSEPDSAPRACFSRQYAYLLVSDAEKRPNDTVQEVGRWCVLGRHFDCTGWMRLHREEYESDHAP